MNDKGFANLVVLIVIGALLVVVGYGLGTKLNTPKDQTAEINQLKSQLEEKDKKLNLDNDDIAEEQIVEGTTPYDFSTFGIYSPLLEGKQVSTTNFDLKGQKIVRKEIILQEGTTEKPNSMGVVVYQYPGGKPSANVAIGNVATFDGYENYGPRAIYLDDLKISWKETYNNKSGLELSYRYINAPKTLSSVHLDFASGISPGGYPIYGWVWLDVPFGSTETSAAVLEAKKTLKTFGETLSLTKN